MLDRCNLNLRCIGADTTCKWHYFILFSWLNTIPFIHEPNLLYPFICCWAFILFPCLDYCLSVATTNIGMHVSFQVRVFSTYRPRSGIARSYGWLSS